MRATHVLVGLDASADGLNTVLAQLDGDREEGQVANDRAPLAGTECLDVDAVTQCELALLALCTRPAH
jgi:hypothetical protein